MRLFGYIAVFAEGVRDNEEEVPNVKCMHIGKGEVLLS
jgi:hypothetical protein